MGLIGRNQTKIGYLILTFGVFLCFVLQYNHSRNLKVVANETHASLCAFKTDLETRRKDTQEYLNAHPLGVVSPVTDAVIIPAAQLQRTIATQTATLEALSILDCSRRP